MGTRSRVMLVRQLACGAFAAALVFAAMRAFGSSLLSEDSVEVLLAPRTAAEVLTELATHGFGPPRADFRCGRRYAGAGCDRTRPGPCCSPSGWCGATYKHCHGRGAHDHRTDLFVNQAHHAEGAALPPRTTPPPRGELAAAFTAPLLMSTSTGGIKLACAAAARADRGTSALPHCAGRRASAAASAAASGALSDGPTRDDMSTKSSWRTDEWRALCPRIVQWWRRVASSGRAPVLQRVTDSGLGDRLRSIQRAFLLAYVSNRPLALQDERGDFPPSILEESLIAWRPLAAQYGGAYDAYHSANDAFERLMTQDDGRAIAIRRTAFPWQREALDEAFWTQWHRDDVDSERRAQWINETAPMAGWLDGDSEVAHLRFCVLRALLKPTPVIIDALDAKLGRAAAGMRTAWRKANDQMSTSGARRRRVASRSILLRRNSDEEALPAPRYVSVQMRFGGTFHGAHDPKRAGPADLAWGVACARNVSRLQRKPIDVSSAEKSTPSESADTGGCPSATVLLLASDHADKLWDSVTAGLVGSVRAQGSGDGGGGGAACVVMESEGTVGHIYKDKSKDIDAVRERTWLDWFLLAEAHDCVFISSGFAGSACAASLRRQRDGGRVFLHDWWGDACFYLPSHFVRILLTIFQPPFSTNSSGILAPRHIFIWSRRDRSPTARSRWDDANRGVYERCDVDSRRAAPLHERVVSPGTQQNWRAEGAPHEVLSYSARQRWRDAWALLLSGQTKVTNALQQRMFPNGSSSAAAMRGAIYSELATNGWKAPDLNGRCGHTSAGRGRGCDRTSAAPCCSKLGWCTGDAKHCASDFAHDFRAMHARATAPLAIGSDGEGVAPPPPTRIAVVTAARADARNVAALLNSLERTASAELTQPAAWRLGLFIGCRPAVARCDDGE